MNGTIMKNLGIIPLKGRVLLPGIVFRMKIRKPNLVKLIKEKVIDNHAGPTKGPVSLALIASLDDGNDSPGPSDLAGVGCAAKVVRIERIVGTEEQYNVTFEGIGRVKVLQYTQEEPFLLADVDHVPEPVWVKGDQEIEALILSLKTVAKEFTEILKELKIPSPWISQVSKIMDNFAPGQLADFLTSITDSSVQEKLEILSTFDLKSRLSKTIPLIKKQIQVLKLSSKVHSTLENNVNKKQREVFLRERLKEIREELGELGKQSGDEIEELERKIDTSGLNEEGRKAIQKDLQKLRKIPQSQPEYTVVKTYLDWIADLPWSNSSSDRISIEDARKQLDGDHFGLEKAKKRILEYLAVKQLKNDLKGPILCFLGPPGVGKTSLGKSIADSLGRKFYRMSLGGVRDEAEVRGHRRTYIGALPGRIIQALKKVGTNNPVILLDEIDKLGKDVRGDPSSALLEVLDPEQNSTFVDHYLALPFDLSKVLFIATANSLEGIPGPLLDRMELVQIPGYTPEEKVRIAQTHILQKQAKNHGISLSDIEIPEETLMKVVSSYTREAGVRNLEREIASICRYTAMQIAEKKERSSKLITPEMLSDILGPEKFEDEIGERLAIPGVVAGLAYTQYGGSLLFVEATKMVGTGKLILTGQLGDVMKESAQAALSWVRANATSIGLSETSSRALFEKNDIHIHFPAGAIPKDGPSAGVTIVSALVSLLSDKPIRALTAMTGEIALRGLVLPVGGIKEKVLAAHRSGIKRVILPARNKRDLSELPPNVLNEIDFILVKSIPDLLKACFTPDESWVLDVPASNL